VSTKICLRLLCHVVRTCVRSCAAPAAPYVLHMRALVHVTHVEWTPIFARGKVRIYVTDLDRARDDASLPQKLADSHNLAKFIRKALPQELQRVREKHGWQDMPRVVVHDKASYMVTAAHEVLQIESLSGITPCAYYNTKKGTGWATEASWMTVLPASVPFFTRASGSHWSDPRNLPPHSIKQRFLASRDPGSH